MEKNRLSPHLRFVRGQFVFLDFDVAPILGVSTKYLNQVVKRNRSRFPEDFCFQVTVEELYRLRLAPGFAPPRLPHLRYLPHVYTKQGLFMAATLMKSDRAIATSIHMLRSVFTPSAKKSTQTKPPHTKSQ